MNRIVLTGAAGNLGGYLRRSLADMADSLVSTDLADGKGHILQASYALSKQIGLKGTFFLNDRNVDFGTEQDFKRLMLDISFKY